MTVSAEALQQFAFAIEARLGMRVTDRLAVLADIITRRSATHHESSDAYLRRVDTGDPDELTALVGEVSVGETYFFRHAEQCQAFAAVVAARGAAGVRVLSAGCSTGEEPYTLAMIAREQRVPAIVHAFDWSAASLARATIGRYGRWALRALPPELERTYFTAAAASRDVVVKPEVRSAVTFFEATLHEDGPWVHGRWDIVFCRNVVMYFGEEKSRRAIDRLIRSLVPGGFLFLGYAEALRDRPDELELCHTHNTFYYRKRDGGPAPQIERLGDWTADIAAATRRVHAMVDQARVATVVPPVVPPSLAPIRAMIVDERFGEARDALAALSPELAASGDAQLLAAVALAQTGKLADAEQVCRDLLARGEHRAAAHYVRSVCTAEPADARAALELDPSFAMASVQLAFLAKRAGDRVGHAAELARAITLLEREDADRLAMFAGGFKKSALIELCRTELARSTP
jgi:chemotaxis protein methyltransferase CheR